MSFTELLEKALSGAAITLPEGGTEKLSAFNEELLRVNEQMNLTAITEPSDMVSKHYIDALKGAGLLPENGKVLDIGSGAGFPGVPLAVARPDVAITLMDALAKRLNFIENALKKAGVPPLALLHGRAEEYGKDPDFRETFDAVTARAVAALPALCEYCLPFVKVGGVFLAYKGPGAAEELAAAGNALKTLGGAAEKTVSYTLAGGEERNILVIRKISPTPAKYPRNPKKIKERPL